MHSGIIPGRHHFAVLGLGRVPARTYVGLGPLENYEGVHIRREGLPLRVRARQMTFNAAQSATIVDLQDGRQMRRRKPLAALRHENGKRPSAHHRVQFGRVLDPEMTRRIHGMDRFQGCLRDGKNDAITPSTTAIGTTISNTTPIVIAAPSRRNAKSPISSAKTISTTAAASQARQPLTTLTLPSRVVTIMVQPPSSMLRLAIAGPPTLPPRPASTPPAADASSPQSPRAAPDFPPLPRAAPWRQSSRWPTWHRSF